MSVAIAVVCLHGVTWSKSKLTSSVPSEQIGLIEHRFTGKCAFNSYEKLAKASLRHAYGHHSTLDCSAKNLYMTPTRDQIQSKTPEEALTESISDSFRYSQIRLPGKSI